MKQEVSQDDRRAAAAIEAATGGQTFSPPFVGLVVTEGEALIAALVFNNFDRINLDLSICVLRPLRVGAIRDVARYVFGRLRVERLTCVTQAENKGAIDRALRLGFTFEGRQRRRFPGGKDGLMFSLLASEQKFARLKDGAEKIQATNGHCRAASRAAGL